MTGDWLSYDSVADTYEAAAVPWFTPIARALVEATCADAGPVRSAVDVGAGTGIVGRLLRRTIGPGPAIVSVDPSAGMLARIPREVGPIVVGGLPRLPLCDGAVDVALANLVLSHVGDPAAAVREMARVVRPGGRIGLTAWAPNPPGGDDLRGRANPVIARVATASGVDQTPPVSAAPSEDMLRDRATLEAVAAEGGDATVLDISQRNEMSAAAAVSGWGGLFRYRRSVVGETAWRRFVDAAAEAVTAEVGPVLHTRDEFRIAVVAVH